MDDRFKDINESRKDKIINSALKEFAKNKYSKSSTNNIVKRAGISRGLLYHYFESKKDLYYFLVDYSTDLIEREVNSNVDWKVKDIFERIKQMIIIKISIFEKYPFIVEFLTMAVSNSKSDPEIMDDNTDFQDKYKNAKVYEDVYNENIDYSLFKDNINLEKALNIIKWTMDKYSEEIQKQILQGESEIDYDKITDEINEYISLLKDNFYK